MTIQNEAPRFRLTLPEPLAALKPAARPTRPEIPTATPRRPRPAAAPAPAAPPAEPATPPAARPAVVPAVVPAAARVAPRAAAAAAATAASPEPAPAAAKAPPQPSLREQRLARRLAEKRGLPAAAGDAALQKLAAKNPPPETLAEGVRLERRAGPLPERSPDDAETLADAPPLPVQIRPGKLAKTGGGPPDKRVQENHAKDIQRIQRDIAKRRRRRMALLWARLWLFVGFPTLLAGIYYGLIATPMYSTRTEFVIQQAEASGGAGLGGLFSGTQFATSQDSIAVQGYLQSRDAMLRLDSELAFRATFASDQVDALQRLENEKSIEAAYEIYQKYVKIAYDPTEGLIKMEVSAPDPALSEAWSRRLITYAEEQVNQLSERLRNDQMRGATDSFTQAEQQLLASQQNVVRLQEENKVLSSEIEISLISSQITALETQLTQDRLALAQMLSNTTPNRARVEPLERRIVTLEREIRSLRDRLTQDDATSGRSLARIQSELLLAQTDVQTRQMLLTQAAQQLETARIEANRQQRYLSLAVAPVAPDIASYPRAFENTAVAMLIFAGIYLLISLTASILREQVAG